MDIKSSNCTSCGELIEHHITEPFASCGCGTSEWYLDDLTPHMISQFKKADININDYKEKH